MPDIYEIILRTFVALFFLLLLTRLVGKQMIAQMTNLQFVASITIGAIAGNTIFNIKIKFLYFLVSLLLFGTIQVALTFIDFKRPSFKKWISGQPTVIIEDGKILEQNLARLKYTIDTLKQALRGKDVFDIHEVEYAIIEVNGSLSILKKPEFRGVIRQDLFLQATPSQFPVELIIEGGIISTNLLQNQLTEEWLFNELANRGLQASDVFYAVKSTNGTLFFDLYNDHIASPIDKE